MFNKFSKLALACLAALSFNSAMAIPITGSVAFHTAGEITRSGTTAIGYDTYDNDAVCPVLTCGSTIVNASGSILDMIQDNGGVLPGGPVGIDLVDDFALADLGTTEVIQWILGPVYDSIAGVEGDLIFELLTGAEVDGTGPLSDIGGTGVFKFEAYADPACLGMDPPPACADPGNTPVSVYEDTIGNWVLSDTGNLSIAGSNVPAPAVLGLFGLGLLGLGFARRRREAV